VPILGVEIHAELHKDIFEAGNAIDNNELNDQQAATALSVFRASGLLLQEHEAFFPAQEAPSPKGTHSYTLNRDRVITKREAAIFSHPITQEAFSWFEGSQEDQNQLIRELTSKQGFRTSPLNLEDLQQPTGNNGYHFDTKIRDIFRLIAYGLGEKRFQNPLQAYTFLRDEVMTSPAISHSFKMRYTQTYGLITPHLENVFYQPWTGLLAPTRKGESPQETAAFIEKWDNLTSIGFEQIGETPYFQQGTFVIHIADNGQPTIFVDYDGFTYDCCARNISGIRTTSRNKEFEMIIKSSSSSFPYFYTKGWKRSHRQSSFPSTMNADEIKALQSAVQGLSMGEQLYRMGFREDKNFEGLLHHESAQTFLGGKNTRLLAFFEHGYLGRFMCSLNEASSRLSPQSSFMNFGSFRNDSYAEPSPSLLVRNGDESLAIGPYGIQKRIELGI
jgi:hypothetical protein